MTEALLIRPNRESICCNLFSAVPVLITFHGNQGGVDFPDGFGNAFLRVCHRANGRGGILFDLRFAHLGSLFLVKAFGIGLDFLAVQSLTGIDGQADAFGKRGNIRE